MSNPRAAFFFGSGISYASYRPFGADAGTVRNISQRLFEEQWKRTAGMFIPADPADDPIFLEEGKRAQGMLRYIKAELDAHLVDREGRESHYEDLYAAALQIFQDQGREITNALIARSIEALRLAAASLYIGGDRSAFNDPFATLVERSRELVQSVAWMELGQAAEPKNLSVLSDLAKVTGEVDIFTLNHDTLVEKQLQSAGLVFSDGFGEVRPGYRIFNGHWPDGPGVRLLKLHGSLNWYFCRFKRFRQYASFDQPTDGCRDDDGSRISRSVFPEFLTGTTVKEQSYGHSLIGEIFSRFRQFSSHHRRIVCCGYGWGDKGINIRLDQWLNDQPENRLVILHGGQLEEVLKARFWWRRWEEYTASGKVVVHPKWLSDCAVSEIETLFT